MKSLNRVRLFATPWTVACSRFLRPWDFLGKSSGMGWHFLLQGIFPTQGLNPGLQLYRQTVYRLSLGTQKVEGVKNFPPISVSNPFVPLFGGNQSHVFPLRHKLWLFSPFYANGVIHSMTFRLLFSSYLFNSLSCGLFHISSEKHSLIFFSAL